MNRLSLGGACSWASCGLCGRCGLGHEREPEPKGPDGLASLFVGCPVCRRQMLKTQVAEHERETGHHVMRQSA